MENCFLHPLIYFLHLIISLKYQNYPCVGLRKMFSEIHFGGCKNDLLKTFFPIHFGGVQNSSGKRFSKFKINLRKIFSKMHFGQNSFGKCFLEYKNDLWKGFSETLLQMSFSENSFRKSFPEKFKIFEEKYCYENPFPSSSRKRIFEKPLAPLRQYPAPPPIATHNPHHQQPIIYLYTT